jgi:HEAT repeat protein
MLARLEHQDSENRETAATVLAEIGKSSEEVFPALRKGLADPVGRVRAACAAALVPFGRSHKEVQQDLQKLARDDEFLFVRAMAKHSLQRIADEAN